MSDLKTKRNNADVDVFISTVGNETRRHDSYQVLEIMKKVTKKSPEMWGDNIVGFGTYYYQYESGQEGNWFTTGFSPRKQNLTLYIMPGFSQLEDLLAKLGKHKLGKSCLYINKLSDVNLKVLEQITKSSVVQLCKQHPCS